MRITKLPHACVRVEHDGVVLVIDPGNYAEASVLDGADAVLITHEHPDHYFADHLTSYSGRVFTQEAVAERIAEDLPGLADRTTVVRPGEEFDAGIRVRAVGELHAEIHHEYPRTRNTGFLVLGDETIYHPGDALTPPGQEIDVLLLPVAAPWMRASEAVEYARLVKAPRNVAIHDRVYSEAGLGIIAQHMNNFLPQEGMDYLRLADGQDL